jgi:hypothetical protein
MLRGGGRNCITKHGDMRLARKLTSILWLTALPFSLKAQADSANIRLYVLMASSEDLITALGNEPLNPSESDTTRPSVLYWLEDSRLHAIDTINFDHRIGSTMRECRHFEEFKFFYIREQETRGKWVNDKSGRYYFVFYETNFVSVLDYSRDTLVLRKAVADSISNHCRLLNGQAYLQDGELLYSFSVCDNQKRYERNVIDKMLHVSAIKEQTFLNGRYGKSEASFFGRNNAGLPFSKTKGRLVISFDGTMDITQWPEADFQFPYEVNAAKYSNISYLLKTPLCGKEVLHKRLFNGGTDSICSYYVYDKRTGLLDSITTPYQLSGMNLYKDYIGHGTLALNPAYSKNEEKDMPLPSRYLKVHGSVPNLQYNTGGFYLWDLRANEFKTYFFEDLDTELLSIYEDWVYFRVFDEIRRLRLSDLDSADYKQKAEVLYKDAERVPHIHHVFWAPKMPFKVEHVTGRGG